MCAHQQAYMGHSLHVETRIQFVGIGSLLLCGGLESVVRLSSKYLYSVKLSQQPLKKMLQVINIFFLLLFLLLLPFPTPLSDRVSLYSPGCSGTLKDLLTFASQVPGLEACATAGLTPSIHYILISF